MYYSLQTFQQNRNQCLKISKKLSHKHMQYMPTVHIQKNYHIGDKTIHSKHKNSINVKTEISSNLPLFKPTPYNVRCFYT